MEDIEHYDIPVYNFPYDVEEDDEETIQDNSELRVSPIQFVLFLSIYLTRFRLYFHSLLLVRKRRSTSTGSLSVRVSIHGVLPRSTTPNTLISAD